METGAARGSDLKSRCFPLLHWGCGNRPGLEIRRPFQSGWQIHTQWLRRDQEIVSNHEKRFCHILYSTKVMRESREGAGLECGCRLGRANLTRGTVPRWVNRKGWRAKEEG